MRSGNSTTFYLVRHGEAESNVERRLSSWPERVPAALTAKGRVQAEQAGKTLAGRGVSIIISSPSRRTRETAEAIARATGADIIFDERLRETDFGIYDGGPIAVMRDRYPEDADRIDTDRSEIEGIRHIRKRVDEFLHETASRFAGKTIVVVSHGDTLETLYGALHGLTVEEGVRSWYPDKGSVTEVVIEEPGS